MITEPDIDKTQLQALVEENYKIRIKSLTFQPKGEVSWSYIVNCEDNTQYFLKIHKTKDLPISRLQLLYDLHSKCKIESISYPIKTTTGDLEIEVIGYPAVLFNFIDGKTSKDQELTQEDLRRLGELLSNIHNSKDIIGPFGVKEQFKHPFREGIIKIYHELDSLDNLNEPQKKAVEIYGQYKDIFLEELETLESLGNELKSKDIEFVNCHGEPSPDNIMISDNGQIYLIDWDGPIFGPKEKDLMFFTNRLDPVLSGYGYNIQLNQEVLRYYQLLWNVQEIEDWGTRLFFEEHPLNEYEYYLKQLKHFLDYSGLGKKKS